MVVMLVKGLLRLFSNANLCPNRLTFSVINPLGYQSRFYFRNIHTSADIVSESTNYDIQDKSTEQFSFKEYIRTNNNFRSSFSDIINLNFSFDDKHKSLKLLAKLKENLENIWLWQEMLDCLNREVSTFDIEDFLKVMVLASDVGVKKDTQNLFSDFITPLDRELKSRTLNMGDILEILFVLKYTLLKGKSLKHFRFYLKFYRSFGKLYKFQPLQVIHIFHYLEELNDESKSIYKYPMLKYVKENLQQFNAVEMAIILAALVRVKLFIPDVQFIQEITDKLLNEIESVQSVHLYYLSKFLSGSSTNNTFEVILNFQDKLIPHISKFNAKSLISTLLSGHPYALNFSFWNNVVEIIKAELKTLCMADIQRVTSITTAFKVNDAGLLKLLIEEVEERQDLQTVFPHFVTFCKHLVIHQIYPKNLLDVVLSKDFIDNMRARSFLREMGDWAFLNYSLQVDKPEYQCTCLNEASEKQIMKKLFAHITSKVPAISPFKTRIFLFKHLKSMFGENEVIETLCLPHFERGVVMRFDENFNATVIPENFKVRAKKLVSIPLDQHFWICMNASIIQPEGPSPIQETYMRHLSACGYQPILVQKSEFYYYYNLGKEELNKYLNDIIQNHLSQFCRSNGSQN